MSTKRSVRVVLMLAALGLPASAALADEIIHFTNGAEMPVRSHTIDKEKRMVRLDLGANSFIAFPMSMVDKIVSSGQDVFLNPGFHPSNQAIAGIPGTAVADTTIRGTSAYRQSAAQQRRFAKLPTMRGIGSCQPCADNSGTPPSFSNSQRSWMRSRMVCCLEYKRPPASCCSGR